MALLHVQQNNAENKTSNSQPKVIRDLNLDFRINSDLDVCQIAPKLLQIHYTVGVSYFAKFCKNQR